jgi:hypothetical protein
LSWSVGVVRDQVLYNCVSMANAFSNNIFYFFKSYSMVLLGFEILSSCGVEQASEFGSYSRFTDQLWSFF